MGSGAATHDVTPRLVAPPHQPPARLARTGISLRAVHPCFPPTTTLVASLIMRASALRLLKAVPGARPMPGPTHASRTSPATGKGALHQHPGYTRADEPITSKDPSQMSAPPEGSAGSR
jgi:hypothetical protein